MPNLTVGRTKPCNLSAELGRCREAFQEKPELSLAVLDPVAGSVVVGTGSELYISMQSDPLRLFNEMAEELERARLLESMRDGRGGFSIRWTRPGRATVESDMPHMEEIKAYVLTFRLFLQPNESFSFTKLRLAYQKLPISTAVKDRAIGIIDRVDAYLSGPSTLVMNLETPSRRRVYDLVVYGGLAHANAEKKAIRDYWAGNAELDAFMKAEFLEILMNLTQFIFSLRPANLDALAELST